MHQYNLEKIVIPIKAIIIRVSPVFIRILSITFLSSPSSLDDVFVYFFIYKINIWITYHSLLHFRPSVCS